MRGPRSSMVAIPRRPVRLRTPRTPILEGSGLPTLRSPRSTHCAGRGGPASQRAPSVGLSPSAAAVTLGAGVCPTWGYVLAHLSTSTDALKWNPFVKALGRTGQLVVAAAVSFAAHLALAAQRSQFQFSPRLYEPHSNLPVPSTVDERGIVCFCVASFTNREVFRPASEHATKEAFHSSSSSKTSAGETVTGRMISMK